MVSVTWDYTYLPKETDTHLLKDTVEDHNGEEAIAPFHKQKGNRILETLIWAMSTNGCKPQNLLLHIWKWKLFYNAIKTKQTKNQHLISLVRLNLFFSVIFLLQITLKFDCHRQLQFDSQRHWTSTCFSHAVKPRIELLHYSGNMHSQISAFEYSNMC